MNPEDLDMHNLQAHAVRQTGSDFHFYNMMNLDVRGLLEVQGMPVYWWIDPTAGLTCWPKPSEGWTAEFNWRSRQGFPMNWSIRYEGPVEPGPW